MTEPQILEIEMRDFSDRIDELKSATVFDHNLDNPEMESTALCALAASTLNVLMHRTTRPNEAMQILAMCVAGMVQMATEVGGLPFQDARDQALFVIANLVDNSKAVHVASN